MPPPGSRRVDQPLTDPPGQADIQSGPFPAAYWLDVYLDGEKVGGLVQRVDVAAGNVWFVMHDADGKPIHDDGLIRATEYLSGKVEVRWRDDTPDAVKTAVWSYRATQRMPQEFELELAELVRRYSDKGIQPKDLARALTLRLTALHDEFGP